MLMLLASAGSAGAQQAGIDRLQRDVLAAPSATQFLARRCAELHLAEPATIRAETVPADNAATPQVRALLQVGADEPVRHRHVRLVCGTHLLSEADNWYVPARLTAEMNRSLETSDTPFGTVVRPLDFHRQTLGTARPSGAAVLQVKAVLLTPQETPISLVIENYSGELLGEEKP